MRRWTWLAAMAGTVLLLAGCTGGGEATDDGGPADLTAEDFSFSPTELTATVGEEAAFEVANDGDVPHNVTIEELDVDEDVDAGEHTFVTVTPEEPGEFEFYCALHPEQMTGTLTVSE